MTQQQRRDAFQNIAQHTTSFNCGATWAFDEFIAPLLEALERVNKSEVRHEFPANYSEAILNVGDVLKAFDAKLSMGEK